MDTKNLTFEQLPQAVGLLIEEVKQLRAELTKQKEEDIWMTVEDLIEYLPGHPAKITVYTWASKKRIPFHKKGRALTFLKSEIDDWMK